MNNFTDNAASSSKKRKIDDDQNQNHEGLMHISNPSMMSVSPRTLAKQKLRLDHKRLQNQLKCDPFALLPEVAVRDHLAKYLDTRDKINVSRVSPTVKRFLGTTNASWMLSNALAVPHLQKTLCQLANDAGKKNYHNVINISILKDLRLVCRDWRWSVDNYFNRAYDQLPNYSRSRSVHTSLLSLSQTRYEGNWSETYFDAEDEDSLGKPYFFMSTLRNKMQNFIDDFQVHNSCPIITKSIHIYLRPGALTKKEKGVTREGFAWENPGVATLLDKFGKDILCAEVSQYAESLDTETINQLRKALYRMPNLIYLHFKNDTGNEVGQLNPRSPPFPPLPNLKVLVIYNRTRIRESTLRFLPLMKNYFNQIHTLVVTRTALLDWYDPAKHSKFPNLKRLSILVEDKDQLCKLREWTSPLKEVKIRSKLHSKLGVYLHGLESFWGSLVAIDIDEVGSWGDGNRLGMAELKLPERDVFTLPQLQILVVYGMEECEEAQTLQKLSHKPRFSKFV